MMKNKEVERNMNTLKFSKVAELKGGKRQYNF